MRANQATDADQEIQAIGMVHAALKALSPDAQARVIRYVADKLNLALSDVTSGSHLSSDAGETERAQTVALAADAPERTTHQSDQGLEGVSPVARKWLVRSGFSAAELSHIFSIGGDEIDLVARTIPGDSIREKMRSVWLLKGVAAYLASGAPRFTYSQLKESCLHYGAYDVNNFARHLKEYASEISGDKAIGLSLTARGLAEATQTVRAMVQGQKPA